jgi:hypothetical protein
MRGVLLASIAFALVGSSLAAQDRKGITSELGELGERSMRPSAQRCAGDPPIDPRGLLGLRQQTAAFLLRLLRS